jgi:hypothetical protein
LSKSDEGTLVIWEREIFRKIFGPVQAAGMWRMCTNQELMNLYRELNAILKIRKGSLSWLECKKKEL